MPPRSKTPSRRAAAASPVKSPEPAKTPRAKAAAATTPKAVTPKAVTPKVQKAAKGSKKGGMSLLKYGTWGPGAPRSRLRLRPLAFFPARSPRLVQRRWA